MATLKGITVKIGGDVKGLNEALSSVNKNIKGTQGELKEVEKRLKLDPTNTTMLAQKQELLKKAIENTSDKLKALKEAEAQVQEQVKKGDASEEQYRKLQREIVAAEQSLKSLEKQADDTNKATSKISATVDKIGSAASNVASKTKGLSTAAAAGVGGLVAMAVKAGQSADDINTLAKQTGLSTEQIQKFSYASDIIDVDLQTLTGSLAKLTRNMQSAKNGSKNTQAAFDALGVSIVDQNGNLRDNQDVFNEAISALAKIEEETQRDAYAMQIFGKSAQDLNPLILGGADDLKKLGDEAEAAGLILSQDALDGANEFNDSIDKMKATATTSFGKVAGQLAEVLIPVMEQLTTIVSKLLTFISDLSPETLQILTTVLLVVAAISPIATMVSGITTAVNGLGIALTFLSAHPIIAIITAVTLAIATIALFGDEIQAVLSNADDFLQNIFAKDWTETFGVLGRPLNALFTFFKEIWQSVKTILDGVIDLIRGVFTGNWQRALDGIVKILVGTLDWVITHLNRLIDGLNLVILPFRAIIAGIGSIFGAEWTLDNIKIPHIPLLAKGGEVLKGSAIVGEAGAELLTVSGGRTTVTPLTNGERAHSVSGAQYNLNFNIETLNNLDSSSTAEDLVNMTMERIEFITQRKGAAVGA